MRIGQGLPGFGRSRLNKLVRVSVGTLNVGSMTGRGRELAEKGRSVQESRWKGNKASELGGYCKLLYRGAYERGRNGVGMALSKKQLKDSLVSVSRRNDRVMSVKLGTHIQNMGDGG